MECFICCRSIPDDLDLDLDTPNPNLTSIHVICKLLDISISTIDNSSTYFCPKCSGQIDQVEDLYKELDEIHERLEVIKKEFEKELIGSHKLSEFRRNQFNLRSKIVKGIGQGKSSLINPDEVTIKVEKEYQDNYYEGEADQQGFEDPPINTVDDDDDIDGMDITEDDNTRFPAKKLKIILDERVEDEPKTKNNDKNKVRNSKAQKILDSEDIRNNFFKQNNRRMVKCPTCSKILRSYDLKVHQRKHTGEKPFRCKFRDCNKRFPSAHQLKVHQSIHGIGGYTATCQYCGKTMTKSSLKLHMARIHPNQSQNQDSKSTEESNLNYLCHICSENFTSVLLLGAHIRTKHTKYKCTFPDCPKVFNSHNGWSSHIVKVHTNNYRFYCTQCEVPKGFLKKFDLDNHIVTVHEHQRPFLCSFCPKSYVTKQPLDHHILRKHTVNPNFRVNCPICGKGFIHSYRMKLHLVACEKHKDVEKSHECSICNLKFRSYGTLKSHKSRKHRNEMKKEKEKLEHAEEETSNSDSNLT